jgi:hypothetical protein
MEKENIYSIVRKIENEYIFGTVKDGKYVERSMYEDIEKIDAYYNSKHISGDRDSMGRERPFFNIVTAAVNIWYRATDIDRKHIRIKATRAGQTIIAFIATILLQEWMRTNSFGQFLNDWGRALAKYGSSVLKFVEKDGKLYSEVVPWNRLIIDPVDFDNNPKIEKLYFTPAQLRMKEGYDKEQIDALIETAQKAREDMSRQKKDNRADYIEVYEIHGMFPLSFLTDDEKDEDIFVQQMHVVSSVAKGKGKNKIHEDFCLIRGKEKQDPYMITHLIREDGKTLSIGAVQHLFEAQWMVNHSQKSVKDQLDLASKLIFQSADDSFVGTNALNSIETGDILTHKPNMPLTALNNNSHDITSLQNFGNEWKMLAQEITSTPDSLMGSTMPSGTAWRQVEALQSEAHSLFELMTENKGLYIEEMFRKYVIPHFKKKLDTSDEIAAILSREQIEKIDSAYIPSEAIKRSNKKLKENLLKGIPTTQSEQMTDIANEGSLIQQEMKQLGNQRFIKPSEIDDKKWKEVLKDLEWELEVEVTGEATDKQAALTTLNTVFTTLARNPAILENKKIAYVFNKILETTGNISTVELSQIEDTPIQSPAQVTPQSIVEPVQ